MLMIAALHHAAGDGLRGEEDTAEIGVEDQVPIVPGHFERGLANVAAGVVDEDVEPACGGPRGIGGGFDARLLADIKHDRPRLAAEGFDLGDGGIER
jgi:hypothetical protein